MNDKKRVHVIIKGRVQGVSFRMETRRTAMDLGIKGWVKNRPDGDVEAVFVGDNESVDKMVDWCHQGPSLARVTDVRVSEEPFEGDFDSFDIAY